MLTQFLARQFARPSGLLGRVWIAPWLDRISAGMNRLALAQLAPQCDETILEIGFGGGALLDVILAATAGDVHAADISAVALARARRRFRRHGARLHLIQTSPERLPLPDAAIDKAVSVNSLYFWPDLDAALAELARVVRPRGLLILCFEPPEELRKWPGHVHGFKAYDAAEIVARAAAFELVGCVAVRGRKPDRFLCLSLMRRADTEGHD
ncbi:class I SAM-dependent methyltransferase [Sphingosinicella sp. BN140058]|uniref:class I SAM-dependent methyltransferase n=1 Tax=Sphingosinicella sp. BN140058 TaxID=1892855 RepID=UPI0010110A8D|nr:class I SAM-dependent methyltransferase [Sphingosinicella sp. BN140058]QAY78994.1 class I SAM-dependent methyltransferase [Sphingosinicella sp. BN140058]